MSGRPIFLETFTVFRSSPMYMTQSRVRLPKIRTILIGLLFVLSVTSGGLYFWLLADLPPITAAEARLVRPTTQILDRNFNLFFIIWGY